LEEAAAAVPEEEAGAAPAVASLVAGAGPAVPLHLREYTGPEDSLEADGSGPLGGLW